jgi:hypothetical protein
MEDNKAEMTQKKGEPALLEMELTPFMTKVMRDIFEVEMLQGHNEPMPDGRIKWTITIEDEEKANLFRQWMVKFFFANKIDKN